MKRSPARKDSAKELIPGISPSEFMKDRRLVMADKLSKMATLCARSKITEVHANDSVSLKPFTVPMDTPLFEAFPSEIHLQNYEPFQTYEVVITFRNIDRFARHLRIKPLDSSMFTIAALKFNSLQTHKLATGMEAQFVLKFTPPDSNDYSYTIECVTERETFFVPIFAIGNRAIIDLSDEITFGKCPVNYTTSKTQLLRNIGDAPAKFTFTTESPFFLSPSSGFLLPNASMQLELSLEPKKTGQYTGTLVLQYETGEKITTLLRASVHEIDIYLAKKQIAFVDQSIQKNRVERVTIANESDVMVRFEWKQFASDELEAAHRKAKIDLLNAGYKALLEGGGVDAVLESRKVKKEILAVESEMYLCEDGVFGIEPREGVIWPHACVDVSVMFSPDRCGTVEDVKYCSISGVQSRLALNLKGCGFGPKLKLSKNHWTAGDVFLGTEHTFDFFFENKGQIPAPFTFPSAFESAALKFEPSSGLVDVHGKFPVQLRFTPTSLGAHELLIRVPVTGSDTPLTFVLKWVCLGPTFEFDTTEVAFGNISTGFTSNQQVTLVNTSPIPFHYAFHVESDGLFGLKPDHGVIQALGSRLIKISCSPKSVCELNGNLFLGIKEIGEKVHSIPITAESNAPKIVINNSVINFNQCFLTVSYNDTIIVRNDSALFGVLELTCNEGVTSLLYEIELSMISNIIEPNSELIINVRVVALSLGAFSIPITVAIKNAADRKCTIIANINGVGPEITVNAKEVKFGKVQVLETHKIALLLKNISPIPAIYSSALIHPHSHFIIHKGSGVLQPTERVEIDVEATLFDNFKFTDVMKLLVENGRVRDIQLSAQGVGSNVLFSTDVKRVSFGETLTSEYCERVITVTNHSKRTQNIMFKNSCEVDPVFTVTPDRFSLKSLGELQITIKGFSKVAKTISETFLCFGTLEQDPNRKTIVESVVSACFIAPSVSLDKTKLEFEYIQGEQAKLQRTEHNLIITNNVNLPIKIKAVCPLLFTINRDTTFILQPKEVLKLTVKYDPECNTDRKCSKLSSQLLLTFNNQFEALSVELVAEMSYPNLTLSSDLIEITSTSPGFRKSESFRITNSGALPVYYDWQIERSRSKFVYEGGEEQVDPTLFDIFPSHGVLFHGEVMSTSITFLSQRKGTFSIGFICKVRDGTSYRLKASVRCYEVGYAVSANTIELGEICFDEIVERSIVIKNTGEVEFPMHIFNSENVVFSKQKLSITASTMIVNPGESSTLSIKYCPCFLGPLSETFYIQMSNQRPEKFTINVESLYPCYSIDLPPMNPRQVGIELPIDEEWKLNESISNALSVFEDEGKSILNMSVKNDMSRLRDRKSPRADQASFLSGTPDFHGNYVCNFGFLSQTQIKKKSIVLKNTGKIPFSIQSVKGAFEEKGFALEFEQYLKLGPGESQKIGLTLKAPKNIMDDTLVKVEAIIELSHGCRISIMLTASLNVPSIVCAAKEVDFGEVFVGQKKSVSVLLTNHSAVVCDWKLPTPSISKSNTKKKLEVILPKEIVFASSFGQLQPGQSTYIDISFTPKNNQLIQFNTIIQVIGSSRPLEIPIKAIGVHPRLIVETPTLNFGQIVPYSESLERSIVFRNPTKYPLELMVADLVDVDDVMLSNPAIEECIIPAQECRSLYIFNGPPLSGKSTLALHLCDQYDLKYMSIDDIITDAAERRGNPLLDRIKIELLKVRNESRQDEQNDYDPATDFDMALFALILADHISRIQISVQVMVMDGLNSQFIKNPSLIFKTLLHVFDASTKVTFINIVADVSLLQKRERDRNQVVIASQIAELERELSSIQRKSDGIENFERIMSEIARLRKLNADRRENEKQPWKAAVRVTDDPKRGKFSLKPGVKDKPQKKPLLRASNASNDDMETTNVDVNMVLITDVFEEKKESLEYEEFISTIDALTATVLDSCQEGSRSGDKRKKSQEGEQLEFKKEECVVNIDFASFSELNESIAEMAKILNLVKPEEPIVESKPAIITAIQHLKVVCDNKPQPKNFQIVSCSMQTDDQAQSTLTSLRRWTLESNEKLNIIVKFVPANIGRIDETMSFNVRGIRDCYQVKCVALTVHPSFSSNAIFSKQRKTRDPDDVISGEFICDTNTFEFGHLVCRSKDLKGPERHKGIFTISNDSENSIRVSVLLKSDIKGDVFSIDAHSFTVLPNASHVLTVFAFPKNAGVFDDILICSIAENPEPFLINLSCTGTKLEMELDKKQMNFDRNSFGVVERREISLRNPTTIAAGWKINMLDMNTEELQLSPLEGTVQPHEKIVINGTFKSMKQIVLKKSIKVDMYELERPGIVVSENIFTVLAEAYEVAVDVVYSKAGVDFVDFSSLRVEEESKQFISLKNRGKFDIGYRFVSTKDDYEPLFDITPSSGALSINDKSIGIQIALTCPSERFFVQESMLVCELYDLTRDSILGRLPIKVSAQVVRSSHLVTPGKSLEFGKCCIGAKSVRSVTIENNGPYDLRYAFGRQLRPISTFGGAAYSLQKKKARAAQLLATGEKTKKDLQRSEMQVFGAFSIHNPIGSIPANSKATLVVEFLADGEGMYTETLILDCSDRDDFYEDALEYVFTGESQIPSLRIDNFAKMFQTIDIIRDLSYWQGAYPVFSVGDNTLFLGNTLLGTAINVPIILSNVTDVNCDIVLSVKAKHKNDEQTFDVTPKTQTIGPQESSQSMITFQSMDLENAYGSFDVTVENPKNEQRIRFDICARSIVPQIDLVPTNSTIYKFTRTPIGSVSKTCITLCNKNLVKCTIVFRGLDDETFYESDPTNCTLLPRETRDFFIEFKPTASSVNEKEIGVSCAENIFESFTINLVGETSENTISVLSNGNETTEISFGDCFTGMPRSVNMTIRNDFAKPQRIMLSMPSEIYASPNGFVLGSCEQKELQMTFQSDKKYKEFKAQVKLQIQDVEGVLADKEVILSTEASNGYAAYECSQSAVSFTSTPVFDQQATTIELKNIGRHPLEYEIKFYRDDGHVQVDEVPFGVCRKSGCVDVAATLSLIFSFCATVVGTYNNYSAVLLVKHTDPTELPHCIRLSGVSVEKSIHLSCVPTRSDNMNSACFDWVTYACEESSKRIVLLNNMSESPLAYTIKPQDYSGEIHVACTEGQFVAGMNEIHFTIKSSRIESKVGYPVAFIDTKEFKFMLNIAGRPTECIVIQHAAKALEVSVDKYSINFSNIKLHKSSSKTFMLLNNEKYTVDYAIEVLKEHGHAKSFQLDSLVGSIPPFSSVQRTVTFRPDFDRLYESSLRVSYTNCPSLAEQILYLSGDGYDLLETVILCEGGIERVLQAGEKSKEVFDVGRLVLGEEKTSQISIENKGRYAFEFNWGIVGPITKIIKISPLQGSVNPGETVLCNLDFLSYQQLKDRRITAVCTIDKERKYPIHINTYFTRSRIDLSETDIAFGLNFLHSKESARVLRIVNREKRDIVIESSLSHPQTFISSLKYHTLPEGESLDVTVLFKPESRFEYSDVLLIKVDEHSEYKIPITGTGIHHDLQVLDVKDNVVDFGLMKAVSTYSRKIRVKNNSALALQIQVADKDTLTHLLQLGCKITPERITIKPKEIVPMNLTFTPKGRLGSICQELLVFTNETVIKAIGIIGSCQGIELHLSEQSLFLGPTLPNVAVYKTILLENVGEIGSKFVWDTSKFNGIFSMDPKEGFISPKASVSLKFGFKTRSFLQDVKTESITCQIDGAKHLTLQLSGSCPRNPVITESISFTTNVRGKDVKSITVTNPTTALWRVQPAISGQLFSAIHELAIEPNQSKQISITYSPLHMTSDKLDEGFLNIPLPNNTSKLYKLIGASEKPLACFDVCLQIKSRLLTHETISVSNWVSKPQKLSVVCESNDPMMVVSGPKVFELASGETKPYQFTIQCLKDGTYPVKVTLTNEANGEYIWYNFLYKALLTDPEPITISTFVRTKAQKSITLKNPLDVSLTMTFTSSSLDITIPPTLVLAPRSETLVNIDYLPTQLGESTAKLFSTSSEFGSIIYELKLLSKQSKPTPPLAFTAPLGSIQTQVVKFMSYSKTRTEYTCKIEHADFSCERVIVAMPSAAPCELSFDVVFEPSVVGSVKTLLTVSSVAFGDYEFVLLGVCGDPTAQGPYLVKSGVSFNLVLRNVAHVAAAYSYTIDNPCFSVKCPETIAARKTGQIVIGYVAGKMGEKQVVPSKTGKMVVTNTVSGVSWTYYLKEQ